MPVHIVAFVITVALLAILPGAGTASITRQTMMFGRRAGWLTVAGNSSGILLWAIAAAAGLSAVLLANPHAFLALRVGGAAFLVALGVRTLWSVRRPPAAVPDHGHESGHTRTGFAVGIATSLGNPKAGVFAVSLLPQFVTTSGPVLASSIALGAVWAVVSGLWFVGLVYALDRGRARVGRPSVQRWIETVSGLTLLGLGVAVAMGA